MVVVGGVLLGLIEVSARCGYEGPRHTTHLGQGIDSLGKSVREVAVLYLDLVLGVGKLQLLTVFCVGRCN